MAGSGCGAQTRRTSARTWSAGVASISASSASRSPSGLLGGGLMKSGV
jgi:hypothetical protein